MVVLFVSKMTLFFSMTGSKMNNEGSNEGVKHISEALKTNTTLTTLSLMSEESCALFVKHNFVYFQ